MFSSHCLSPQQGNILRWPCYDPVMMMIKVPAVIIFEKNNCLHLSLVLSAITLHNFILLRLQSISSFIILQLRKLKLGEVKDLHKPHRWSTPQVDFRDMSVFQQTE